MSVINALHILVRDHFTKCTVDTSPRSRYTNLVPLGVPLLYPLRLHCLCPRRRRLRPYSTFVYDLLERKQGEV